MSVPEFTAQASLYRTSRHYRSSGSGSNGSPSAQSVVAALTFEDTVNCEACENKCNDSTLACTEDAAAIWTLGLAFCAASGPFAPICAIPVTSAYALANLYCWGKNAACKVINCNSPGSPCCPVSCELGHCCSRGETCMPHGCCPINQVVCGGECCRVGDSCCGDTCCPPNYFCRDGFCSDVPSPLAGPKDTSPREPRGRSPDPRIYDKYVTCGVGQTPCGGRCCPPGLQCCYDDPYHTGGVCRDFCGPR